MVVDGEVAKPRAMFWGGLFAPDRLEERIYRLRCVEAWSMVIPWLGFSLGALLKRAELTGQAKFVRFETLVDLERVSMRALGKRWKALLRVVYPIPDLVLLHLLWVVRADLGPWMSYASIGALLLVLSLPFIVGRLPRLLSGSL